MATDDIRLINVEVAEPDPESEVSKMIYIILGIILFVIAFIALN